MTRDDAFEELTARFNARLNGLALQAMGRSQRAAIPDETGEALARIAVEWAQAHGITFD